MQQKTNWRRFLILGTSLLLGLFLMSCDKGEVDYTVHLDYFYINKTGVPIRIKTFNAGQTGYNLLKDYTINKNDTLHIDIVSGGPQNLEISEIERPVLSSDSTMVIYNQLKCEVFWPNSGGLNNINSYEVKEVENNFFELEFTFTEEQYQNAEDCK